MRLKTKKDELYQGHKRLRVQEGQDSVCVCVCVCVFKTVNIVSVSARLLRCLLLCYFKQQHAHMQTYANKRACSHMNLRAHTRNEARFPEQSAFLNSSHDSCST